MRDIKCPEKRAKIHELLTKNAQYQAANNCVTNTPEQQKEINDYCDREFILPIKDIDERFYNSINP
jgi:hypothetical protein